MGNVKVFDTSYLSLLTKNEKPLQKREESAFFNKTTSEDPIIRSLAEKNAGTVFASDSIISLLMSCKRAIYPWDIVVRRVGNKLFLDKREGSKIGNDRFSFFSCRVMVYSLCAYFMNSRYAYCG